MNSELKNTGHGHVIPRLDGVKMRCGGPGLCRVCGQEKAALDAAEKPQLTAESNDEIDAVIDRAEQAVGMSHTGWDNVNPRELVRAILALRQQADHPDTARCIKARNDLNAALYGEGAVMDDLESAVANACAKLLRPQTVPMTDEQSELEAEVERLRGLLKLESLRDHSHQCLLCLHPYTPLENQSEDCPSCGFDGINAQGAQGGEG